MTNFNSHFLAVLTVTCVMLTATPSAAEELISVSRSQFKHLKDSRVWEAQVQCSASEDSSLIRKRVGTDSWCDAKDLSNCMGDKNAMAQKVCEQSKDLEQRPAKSELMKEKLRIEEEQLAIEQRKLELRREEIILQKRALELGGVN
jgi:hypothetical protein